MGKKLKLEKDIKAAVQINGVPFVSLEDSMLYQDTEDPNEILIYIKTQDSSKEIKIRIVKEDANNQS